MRQIIMLLALGTSEGLASPEAAVRTIREHEVWTLQGRDREIFVETLLNPPAPNARMKAAVARYKELSA